MTDLRTAAQQALEALDEADTFHRNLPDQRARRLAAMAALRAALAQQDEPVEPVATLTAQRDALLEAIKPLIDLAEFWINHRQKEHMSEQEFKVWLALGHESDAMRNARAAIKAVEETK